MLITKKSMYKVHKALIELLDKIDARTKILKFRRQINTRSAEIFVYFGYGNKNPDNLYFILYQVMLCGSWRTAGDGMNQQWRNNKNGKLIVGAYLQDLSEWIQGCQGF